MNKKSDVDTAMSNSFKPLFFLVGTYINPPPKGFDLLSFTSTPGPQKVHGLVGRKTLADPTSDKNW